MILNLTAWHLLSNTFLIRSLSSAAVAAFGHEISFFFFFKGTLNLTHFSKTHLTTSSFCAATSNLSSQVSSSASRCWTFLIRKFSYIINIFVGNTSSLGFFLFPKETLFFRSTLCTPVQTCHFQLGPLQTLFLVFQSLSCHNLSAQSDF